MKKIIAYILFSLVGLMFLNISHANAQERINDDFVHTVFFWFKNPDNAEERKMFEKSLKKFLEASKHIKTVHVGTPADTEARPVVDQSFTYCLSVVFENKNDHDKYQVEEVHKKFIEESSHLWEKVVVYDSESIW